MLRIRGLKKKSAGASLVEAAVTVPILLLTFLFLIDIGRYVYTYIILLRASHVGADVFAKSVVEVDTSNCASGECDPYESFFQRAVARTLEVATQVADRSTENGAVRLVPFQHYYDGDQDNAATQILPNTGFDVAVLRPGEKVRRPDNTEFEHPTRPFGESSDENFGWPAVGQSWESVLEEHPVAVHIEAVFRPITPIFPSFTIEATQLSYRRTGRFIEGAPPVPSSICGDGEQESPEECDGSDGLTGACTACQSNCFCIECGNNRIDPGEACDGTEGCPGGTCLGCACLYCGDGILSPEIGEVCESDTDCTAGDCVGCNCVNFCGNGVKEDGEECDKLDGLGPGCDSCNPGCTCGYCGDGISSGDEVCDDGNADECDGCSSNCTIPICGNQILECGEECEPCQGACSDGEVVQCNSQCEIIDGACGNGVLDPGEECDDGNNDNFDGCLNSCLHESVCGNGITEPGEACDPGDPGSGVTGDPNCDSDCNYTECGDGIVEGTEECEANSQCTGAGAICNSCECIVPICGNSIQDPGEECDHGANGSNICSSSCTLICGNGQLDPGEECDPPGEICGPLGEQCTSACQCPSSCPPTCVDSLNSGTLAAECQDDQDRCLECDGCPGCVCTGGQG